MKAVIELDVPEWQIGQPVTIYFPDTMRKRGTCEPLKDQSEEIEHRRHLCKCLFNRCYTTNRGEMCKYCACRDECEKERTVDKDA